MRRAMGPGRRGPGVIGTVARTAVVAGTATAVSRGVSGSMDARAMQKQQEQLQQQQVQDQQQQLQQLQLQQQALAAQAANAQAATPAGAAAPGAVSGDTVTQLQKLAELHQQGFLTAEEFAQQKAKILGS